MKFSSIIKRWYCIVVLCFLSVCTSKRLNKRSENEICNEDNTNCVTPLHGVEAFRAKRAFYDGESQIPTAQGKNGIVGKEYRWPGGVVPFVLTPGVLTGSVKIILAMTQYMKQTCVRFVPRTTQKNYIRLIKGEGCYSYVGMQSSLPGQPVSLGDGCMYTGTIVHELGHAVGFYHEHSRSDRDSYIKINTQNIEEKYLPQFVKLEPDENILYNVFDYDGIMLYGNYAFSKSSKLKSMEDINGTRKLVEPYDKPGLTKSDAYRINQMYECDKK